MIPISELDLIKIGEIIKTHGYKGELVIRISVDFDKIKKTEPFFLEIDGIMVPFFFSYPPKPFKKSGILAKFENIDSDNDVVSIISCAVFTTTENLLEEKNEDSESYEAYDVFDNETFIGKAGEFLNIPSNPILTIITESEDEILIPFNDQFIKKIDPISKTIIFDLPDGLLEIND